MARRRRPRTSSDEELETAIEDTTEERGSRRGADAGSRTRRGGRRRAERMAQKELERRVKRQKLLGLAVLLVVVVAIVAALLFTYVDLGGGDGGNPVVVMETNHGTIELELYMDETPKTAGNFKKLVEQGFYDGLTFHRIIEDFMIQGGDPKGDGTGGPGYQIDDEPSALALEHDHGVISMANSGPDTGGSQFFIVTDPDGEHHLDGKHAVFGKVTKGMDVAEKISRLPTGSNDRPISSVVMEKVYIKD